MEDLRVRNYGILFSVFVLVLSLEWQFEVSDMFYISTCALFVMTVVALQLSGNLIDSKELIESKEEPPSLGGKAETEKQKFEEFETMVGLAFQGGGMKSYANFYALLWAIENKHHNLKKIFSDVHIGTNSGGGWFQAALMRSARFWKYFGNPDREAMIQSFNKMFINEGEQLTSDAYHIDELLAKCGISKDSDLYSYCATSCFYDQEEPWRHVVNAMIYDEMDLEEDHIEFASWTNLSILLKAAHTGTTHNYKIELKGDDDNKQLAYPVMLMYTGDVTKPECDIPGIQSDVKVHRYTFTHGLKCTATYQAPRYQEEGGETTSKASASHDEVKFESEAHMDKYYDNHLIASEDDGFHSLCCSDHTSVDEIKKDICNVTGQTFSSFVGPSSSAAGWCASAPYIKEKIPAMTDWVKTAATLLPPALRHYSWPTKSPPGKHNYLCLSDGGTEDNTAISASVYRLQKFGIYSGTIVSFQNAWETERLFEDPGRKVKQGEMYQTIFAGKAPKENDLQFGCNNIRITAFDATTVDNKWSGIVGGKTYRIVVLTCNFKPPLLPGDRNYQGINDCYLESMRGIIDDMNILMKQELLQQYGFKLERLHSNEL